MGKPVKCPSEATWLERKYCSKACRRTGLQQTLRDARDAEHPWSEIARTQVKTCQCCGKEFRPRFYHGTPMSRTAWERTRFCSISCAKKVENPMFRPEVVQKVSDTLREIGHKPAIHGGNGTYLTLPQERIADALGEMAETEYPVSTTRHQRAEGASSCYKLDVAIPYLRLGIQLDGGSHLSRKIRESDRNTRRWLAELGWSVLHISNSKALALCTICKSRDTLLTTLTESWFTTAI